VSDSLRCGFSYVFLLFKQQAELGAKRAQQAAPPERNSFNVRPPCAPLLASLLELLKH